MKNKTFEDLIFNFLMVFIPIGLLLGTFAPLRSITVKPGDDVGVTLTGVYYDINVASETVGNMPLMVARSDYEGGSIILWWPNEDSIFILEEIWPLEAPRFWGEYDSEGNLELHLPLFSKIE
jgi:hypothetical protein